jgi:hypothetical protein
VFALNQNKRQQETTRDNKRQQETTRDNIKSSQSSQLSKHILFVSALNQNKRQQATTGDSTLVKTYSFGVRFKPKQETTRDNKRQPN